MHEIVGVSHVHLVYLNLSSMMEIRHVMRRVGDVFRMAMRHVVMMMVMMPVVSVRVFTLFAEKNM